MANNRALLIGIQTYGDGLEDLPATSHDVDLLAEALEGYGYEIDIAAPEQTQNASALEKLIHDFARPGSEDERRLIFFSGHGISDGESDYILPANVSLEQAKTGSAQRVLTDLSEVVEVGAAGSVLFIIDACRVEPSGARRSYSSKRKRGTHRFVRLFGCEPGDGSYFVPREQAESGDEAGRKVSVFSKALFDILAEQNEISLDSLMERVTTRCTQIAREGDLKPPLQSPRLDIGEVGEEALRALATPFFHPASAQIEWPGFQPGSLSVVVVHSETDSHSGANGQLRYVIGQVLGGENAEEVWNAFRSVAAGRALVSGRYRKIPDDYDPTQLLEKHIPVVDAYRSEESLHATLRAVIQADLVFFDVTGFEPGVLLLAGIRSACRRGLSICSHGKWKSELNRLPKTPFNMADISFSSHTETGSDEAGTSREVRRMLDRVLAGFEQLGETSTYNDLPAFDCLRNPGSADGAFSTIPIKNEILVLCPYSKFGKHWKSNRRQLSNALSKQKLRPKLARLVDLGSPRMVSLSLYDRIRRVAACLMDWSKYSGSVFFELGTRLAVSPRGCVQILEESWMPGMKNSRKIEGSSNDLQQVVHMMNRLRPIVYQYPNDATAFARVAENLTSRNPATEGQATYGWIHALACEAVAEVQERALPIETRLAARAESLQSVESLLAGGSTPQQLFHASAELKVDAEREALEARLALFFYLHHCIGYANMSDNQKTLYLEQGNTIVTSLDGVEGRESLLDLVDRMIAESESIGSQS